MKYTLLVVYEDGSSALLTNSAYGATKWDNLYDALKAKWYWDEKGKEARNTFLYKKYQMEVRCMNLKD